MEWACALGDNVDFEGRLRQLLAWLETDTSSPNSMTLKIIYFLGWDLYLQGRLAEAEHLGLGLLAQAEEQQLPGWKPSAFRLLAYSQYFQSKKSSGEKNLRLGMQITGDEFGMADPMRIEMMVQLEGWLRESGKDEEADRLKEDIDEAIGRDETDVELEGC